MGESNSHKSLKNLAAHILFENGCNYIEYEKSFFRESLRIDVVGFREIGGNPVVGVEVGNINNLTSVYDNLTFPVYHLEYLDNTIQSKPPFLMWRITKKGKAVGFTTDLKKYLFKGLNIN